MGKVWAVVVFLVAAGAGEAGGQEGLRPMPPDKEILKVDKLPGRLGPVVFAHSKHVTLGDGEGEGPVECAVCHHYRKLAKIQPHNEILPCETCHAGVGEQLEILEGKPLLPLARLKPNLAIDQTTVLYHTHCRDACHKKVRRKSRKLFGCKGCHERGISSGSINLRYDEVEDGLRGSSWLRCLAGQSWTLKGCRGAAKTVAWEAAGDACPEDFVVPTRRRILDLLGRCDGSVRAGGEGACSPCEASPRCSSLLSSIDEPAWFAGEGAQGEDVAWTIDLSSGQVRRVSPWEVAGVLCLRGSAPSRGQKGFERREEKEGGCDLHNLTAVRFTLKSGGVSGQVVGSQKRIRIAAGVITGKSDAGQPLGGSCREGGRVKIVRQDGVYLILPD